MFSRCFARAGLAGAGSADGGAGPQSLPAEAKVTLGCDVQSA